MSEAAVATGIAAAGKYLSFHLGEESFGLGILKVQEIIGNMNVTRIPRTPECIRGVINLRGKIIPVIDLRKKFEMASITDTDRTCIIVVRIERDGTRLTMGVLVDQVSEVLDIKREQIEEPPEFGSAVQTNFILAMGKVGNKVVMLLDIDRVLDGREISQAQEAVTGE